MSAEYTIRTNKHWRQFVYRYDVPAEALSSQFDWTDRDFKKNGDYSDGFLCYRGTWYHLGDFMQGGLHADDTWHGHHGDSFFSGVLIRLSDDGEEYQIATYFC